jgi:hypothetical protein
MSDQQMSVEDRLSLMGQRLAAIQACLDARGDSERSMFLTLLSELPSLRSEIVGLRAEIMQRGGMR